MRGVEPLDSNDVVLAAAKTKSSVQILVSRLLKRLRNILNFNHNLVYNCPCRAHILANSSGGSKTCVCNVAVLKTCSLTVGLTLGRLSPACNKRALMSFGCLDYMYVHGILLAEPVR